MSQKLKDAVVGKVKIAQTKMQSFLQKHKGEAKVALNEGKKYVERQGQELKKLIADDAAKVKEFLNKEKQELEKFQKQIPTEAKKLKSFLQSQGKELEKLLQTVQTGKVRETAKVKAKDATAKAKAATAKAKDVAAKAKARVQLKVKSKKKAQSEKVANA